MSQTRPNTPKTSLSKACPAFRDWQPDPSFLQHPTYGTKQGVKDKFLWIGAEKNLCSVLTAWLHGKMETAISECRISMPPSPASRLWPWQCRTNVCLVVGMRGSGETSSGNASGSRD